MSNVCRIERDAVGRLRRPAARCLFATSLVLWLAIGAIVAGGEPAAPAAERHKTPRPPARKIIDYRKPQREYQAVRAGERSIQVEKQLPADAPKLAARAVARLDKKISQALELMPEPARARLKKVRFFLMYGPKARAGGHDNGLEFFQKHAPAHYKHMDPAWGGCVVVYSAENYAGISDFWALKAVFHELAHAHHLEQWPEDQPDIYGAWDKAMKRGLHHGVKDDEGKTLDASYAAVNQLEYFAELSCMYFTGCNYYPFTRTELKAYDPVGYEMIVKMWKIQDAAGPKR